MLAWLQGGRAGEWQAATGTGDRQGSGPLGQVEASSNEPARRAHCPSDCSLAPAEVVWNQVLAAGGGVEGAQLSQEPTPQ